MDRITSKIESILFVAGEPVLLSELCRGLELTDGELKQKLFELQLSYEAEDRGLRLFTTADTVQLTTAAENADAVEAVLNPTQQRSLSNSVLETLAIVAYRQPVTRAEIEEVRGVRCEYAVERLLKLGLIAVSGRKDVPGRPMLLATTDTFLHKFNLTSLDELPQLPQELFETV
ncbi:MAG: SMC-Scp complex subunit ScpB [Clostridia bacterium]|nr:SMC-Scp complex subunit ScpB [Clostridia bacterium]